jgi:hypothetical protein
MGCPDTGYDGAPQVRKILATVDPYLSKDRTLPSHLLENRIGLEFLHATKFRIPEAYGVER